MTKLQFGLTQQNIISIHTSAREVTPCDDLSESGSVRFQSTLPQGKWREEIPEKQLIRNHFNPHFRKGSDQVSDWQHAKGFDFNPHFRKGSDKGVNIDYARDTVFQSTLPQGKWLKRYWGHDENWLFQSTLPQGKWPEVMECRSTEIYFNPHFRKGSDLRSRLIHLPFPSFQSTLPQGKWRYRRSTKSALKTDFNPHFRKGSDSYWISSPSLIANFNPHFRKGSDESGWIW